MIKTIDYAENQDLSFIKRVAETVDVSDIVSGIIEDVRKNGDKALFEYEKKFDKAELSSLEVTKEEIDEAFEKTEDEFIDILKEARDNIYEFHSRQKTNGFIISEKNGIVLGQKVIPLERVGLYAPGGTASYPSTVLMDCIPAKIAGCKEIIMVTPPSPDGKIKPFILAAAKIAGVDRIFKLGGSQAIAALAYGTQSVPAVDKIVGPGNCFVAEAKRQVFGTVDIDMIAGPSEILVIADDTCDPRFVAADLLSQAEHDKMASATLLTNSKALAEKVSAELERQIDLLPRKEIARASIDDYGAIILVSSLEEAVEISNKIAPEHLEICTDSPFDLLGLVKNAGSVFLGKNCPEALGDYFAGPNHTLPTSGTAKFSSPLSVDDFVKRTQFSYYTTDALSKVYDKIAYFADKEGLHAHARSATVRFEE
ncbi:MAG: histidinol dehydrogenase [Clostridiales bacterium]|nr:histidinol dehydrogenase [Clostridiales bacterium]